mmetsp:Transcript_16599/g.54061  ORF Transcript_16599/g.54061 Transcript_16599/m.54061 type:complete len:248 (-) Transcript_16599:300-1043(-)
MVHRPGHQRRRRCEVMRHHHPRLVGQLQAAVSAGLRHPHAGAAAFEETLVDDDAVGGLGPSDTTTTDTTTTTAEAKEAAAGEAGPPKGLEQGLDELFAGAGGGHEGEEARGDEAGEDHGHGEGPGELAVRGVAAEVGGGVDEAEDGDGPAAPEVGLPGVGGPEEAVFRDDDLWLLAEVSRRRMGHGREGKGEDDVDRTRRQLGDHQEALRQHCRRAGKPRPAPDDADAALRRVGRHPRPHDARQRHN